MRWTPRPKDVRKHLSPDFLKSFRQRSRIRIILFHQASSVLTRQAEQSPGSIQPLLQRRDLPDDRLAIFQVQQVHLPAVRTRCHYPESISPADPQTHRFPQARNVPNFPLYLNSDCWKRPYGLAPIPRNIKYTIIVVMIDTTIGQTKEEISSNNLSQSFIKNCWVFDFFIKLS